MTMLLTWLISLVFAGIVGYCCGKEKNEPSLQNANDSLRAQREKLLTRDSELRGENDRLLAEYNRLRLLHEKLSADHEGLKRAYHRDDSLVDRRQQIEQLQQSDPAFIPFEADD